MAAADMCQRGWTLRRAWAVFAWREMQATLCGHRERCHSPLCVQALEGSGPRDQKSVYKTE